MKNKKPSMCRIVSYKLSAGDVNRIDQILPMSVDGQQRRNSVIEGAEYPALIVCTWGDGSSANLQVFLDGDCSYWATSRTEGDEPGKWSWPKREEK